MALHGEKLLVAGATGQVALPLALSLAADNEVWAISRFSDQAARTPWRTAGVTCVAVDLAEPDLAALPTDFTYGLNLPSPSRATGPGTSTPRPGRWPS